MVQPEKKLSRDVIYLASSMFVSAAGTNIILVALSVFLFEETRSALGAAGIFVAQFLPVFILMPVAWRICDMFPARSSLIGLEFASAASTLLVGLCVATGNFWLAYALLFVRGFFDMTTKVARNVAIKTYSEDKDVARSNNLIMVSSYVGQAVGALVGFMLISLLPVLLIAAVNAATFVFSAAICNLLTPAEKIGSATGGYITLFQRGWAALRQDAVITQALGFLVAVVVLHQAFNQVARIWIPLAWLGLPPASGAISEAVGVSGIVAGLLIVNRFITGPSLFTVSLPVAFLCSLLTLLLPFATTQPVLCFSLYFIFMMSFEIVFMISMNRVLTRASRDDVPCLMVIFYGMAFGGMAVSTLLIGSLADRSGLPLVALVLASLGSIIAALLMTVSFLRHKRAD